MLMVILWGIITVLGIAVTLRAGRLSLRYNAWTTRFRERNPHINPPPTPEMRALNTKIMTRLIRIAGAFLALLSSFMLWGSWLLLHGQH